MDSVSRFNKARWEALVQANALFSRPWLNETKESARQRLDPQGRLGNLTGKNVLCLAGGGGQQAVAFALQGARATVFDLSEGQLERDREAARYYGFRHGRQISFHHLHHLCRVLKHLRIVTGRGLLGTPLV